MSDSKQPIIKQLVFGNVSQTRNFTWGEGKEAFSFKLSVTDHDSGEVTRFDVPLYDNVEFVQEAIIDDSDIWACGEVLDDSYTNSEGDRIETKKLRFADVFTRHEVNSKVSEDDSIRVYGKVKFPTLFPPEKESGFKFNINLRNPKVADDDAPNAWLRYECVTFRHAHVWADAIALAEQMHEKLYVWVEGVAKTETFTGRDGTKKSKIKIDIRNLFLPLDVPVVFPDEEPEAPAKTVPAKAAPTKTAPSKAAKAELLDLDDLDVLDVPATPAPTLTPAQQELDTWLADDANFAVGERIRKARFAKLPRQNWHLHLTEDQLAALQAQLSLYQIAYGPAEGVPNIAVPADAAKLSASIKAMLPALAEQGKKPVDIANDLLGTKAAKMGEACKTIGELQAVTLAMIAFLESVKVAVLA